MNGTDPTDLMADVVVAGAGHNGLITAAYVARTGRSVTVLDARPIPGGGAATEELLLPGFRTDSCSTGHTIILNNPMMVDDELDLVGAHGLEYVDPDPVEHVVFPDGEQLTMWLDVDRTERELARFSPADARTYRRLLEEWKQVAPAFAAVNQTPVGWGPSLDDRLEQLPGGDVWRRRRLLSAVEVVDHDFESRHVRAFLLWMAFQTYVSVDLPGSGALVWSLMSGRQRRSWSIPLGGSGRLADALVAEVERHGGVVICDAEVSRLLIEASAASVSRPPTAGASAGAMRSSRRSTSSTWWTWLRKTSGRCRSATPGFDS
jgi:phytoene dehydrogenase-like protein